TVASHFSLFTPPPTPAPYTLSLHDALPISRARRRRARDRAVRPRGSRVRPRDRGRIEASRAPPPRPVQRLQRARCCYPCPRPGRSEEHTSELQSRFDLVCRLLLEKKKKERT